MDYAVDGMNAERSFIFTCFALGVLATLGCLFSAAWVLMEEMVAIVASVIILGTMYMVRASRSRRATKPEAGTSARASAARRVGAATLRATL